MDNSKNIEFEEEYTDEPCDALEEQDSAKKDGKFIKAVKRIFKSPYLYLALTFVIPVAIMYLIYLSMGIHPFGDGSVLVLDLNAQYVYFFEALRNFVRGDASLLYSFSRALGGEFMGIFAYYIASPLSYLVCLFPVDRMLEALLCLFLLKTGICGLTFGYFLHKTTEKLNRCSIVICSVLYALSSYCVVQQHNTMWIDCVMWLPLIALGLQQLIKYGKFKMFTFFLALSVFSNFYIGYMVCIFVAVYFFYYYFSSSNKERNPLAKKNHFLLSISKTVLYSALACGMAMLIILTAYYALQFGKNTFSNPDFTPSSKVDFLDFIAKLFPGSYDTVRPEGLPFVYCGVLTLFLVPLYFLSGKVDSRKKIASAIFIIFFVLSFALTTSDLVWHGLQRPNWLNYRYSFMLIFFLLTLANKGFDAIAETSSKVYIAITSVLAIFLIMIQKEGYAFVDDLGCIWLSFLFIGITLVLLCYMKKPSLKESVSLILVIFVCLEVFCNGLSNCLALNDDVYYSKYSSYNDYLGELRPVVEAIKEEDDSFYRMEKTVHRKTNDNMALGIRGLTNSTSTLNAETIKFLNRLGYASKSHWSKYLGGSPVADSILGLKYIITKNDIDNNHDNKYSTTEYNRLVATQATIDAFYEETLSEGDYTVYFNPYALSLAFGVDSGIYEASLEEETGKYGVKSSYGNPFDCTNDLISSMLGEEIEIFKPISVTSTSSYNMNESYIASHSHFKPIDTSSDATLYYYFDNTHIGTELYFYLPSTYPREVGLKVNAVDYGTFYGNETARIVYLGDDFAGEDTIRVALTIKQNEIYVRDNYDMLYYIDREAFNYAMEALSETQMVIDEYTESEFHGRVTLSGESQTILTTIPYDEGWQIYVDGEMVEYKKALDALISFDIEGEGEHTVTMKYMPKEFVIGLSCTIICIAIFVLLCIIDTRSGRKRKNAESTPVLPKNYNEESGCQEDS